jgi:hypothetical protein
MGVIERKKQRGEPTDHAADSGAVHARDCEHEQREPEQAVQVHQPGLIGPELEVEPMRGHTERAKQPDQQAVVRPPRRPAVLDLPARVCRIAVREAVAAGVQREQALGIRQVRVDVATDEVVQVEAEPEA